MSEIRWSDLRVCGIPVTADPTQQEDGAIVARDGAVLIVNLHWDDEGRLIGATGHVADPDPPEPSP